MKIAFAAFVLLACVQTTAAATCSDGSGYNCAVAGDGYGTSGPGTVVGSADCSSSTCTAAECCAVTDNCAYVASTGTAFACGGGTTGYVAGASTLAATACTVAGCSLETCCAVTDTCDNVASTSGAFACGDGSTNGYEAGASTLDTACTVAGCSLETCCVLLPTCTDTDADGTSTPQEVFSCTNGFEAKTLTSSDFCATSPCGVSDCCDPVPKCTDTDADGTDGDDYACPGDDNTISSGAPDFCATNPCTNSECCTLQTIMDIITPDIDLDELQAAIEEHPGLKILVNGTDGTYLGSKNLTVLAPQDNAFSNVNLEGAALSMDAVKYHLIEDMTTNAIQKTVQGSFIDISKINKFTLAEGAYTPDNPIAGAGGSQIVKIEMVQMMPPNITTLLAADSATEGLLSEILSGVTKVVAGTGDVDTLLAGLFPTGPFTLFLPVDTAFEGDGFKNRSGYNFTEASAQVLGHLIMHHALPGYLFAQDLGGSDTYETKNGDNLNITAGKIYDTDDKEVMISGANILVEGGVIHLIDTVLVPPASKAPTTAPPDGDDDDDDETSPASAVAPMAVTMAAVALIAVLA